MGYCIADNFIYFWKVLANDTDGDTTWSAQTWHFVTNLENEAPTIPDSLRWEHDNLLWSPSSDPDPLDVVESYTIEIDDNPEFASVDLTVSNIEQPYLAIADIIDDLDQGAQYYWHVQAFDGELYSDWSNSLQFEAVLAVELISFSAIPNGRAIVLHWEIMSSRDLSGFHVWRQAENDTDFSRLTNDLLVSSGTVFEYIDELIESDRIYRYRLEDIDLAGGSTFHEVILVQSSLFPDRFVLQQNYPNPFSPKTEIGFGLPKDSAVNLTIYDVTGRLVKKLVADDYMAGYHKVRWNGVNDRNEPVSEGVYFYVLGVENKKLVKRMILIKQ